MASGPMRLQQTKGKPTSVALACEPARTGSQAPPSSTASAGAQIRNKATTRLANPTVQVLKLHPSTRATNTNKRKCMTVNTAMGETLRPKPPCVRALGRRMACGQSTVALEPPHAPQTVRGSKRLSCRRHATTSRQHITSAQPTWLTPMAVSQQPLLMHPRSKGKQGTS